mgnify:CR=1 FL=1
MKNQNLRRFVVNMGIFQEKLPIEEVFEQLKSSKDGLSSEEAKNRLQIFGHNKLEEKPVSQCS